MTLGPEGPPDANLGITMNFRAIFLIALPFVLFAAACGDGPDDGAGTPTAQASATSGGSDDFGPAPTLGGNIVKVSPAHAAQVKQVSTRSPNATRPNGVCVEVSFEDLPELGRWFRLALDGTEVTTQLVWRLGTNTDPTGGTMCFAPAEGIAVGKHTAAVSVQDPNNIQARTRQIVAWKFEVIE